MEEGRGGEVRCSGRLECFNRMPSTFTLIQITGYSSLFLKFFSEQLKHMIDVENSMRNNRDRYIHFIHVSQCLLK